MKTLLTLLTLLLLASCSSRPANPFIPPPGSTEWPLPPDFPRVRHVRSFAEHQDLFLIGNVFTRMVDFVFGSEEIYMVRPHGLAIHPAGGILVTDPGIGRVHFFDIPRRRYRMLGDDLPSGLPSPIAVAVTIDGEILVTDSRLRSIERFSRTGAHLGRFAAAHDFQRPGGIVVDPISGSVYIVDILQHCIFVFGPDGSLSRQFGGNGVLPGLFNFPTHLAMTPSGNLLVADSMNFRIQTVSPQGDPLASYGDPGNARGNFARPKGVGSIDEGVHVAVEGLYSSLVFFNTAGDLLLSIGESGSDEGQFWLPAGLAYDRSRNLIFVADSYNSRVQVFQMLPAPDDLPIGKVVEP